MAHINGKITQEGVVNKNVANRNIDVIYFQKLSLTERDIGTWFAHSAYYFMLLQCFGEWYNL